MADEEQITVRGPLQDMPIKLLPYEQRSLDALALKFSLEGELVVGLAKDLNLFARLFERVISHPEPEFMAGRVVIMGLINHVHCLLEQDDFVLNRDFPDAGVI